LSVAATNSHDQKWIHSSFNRFVDISAPGQGILSTIPNARYFSTSGTSFAAPVVAGAAAILRYHFPQYSARQVAAQLKVTADNIYHLTANIPFTGMLGTGRLNLYRALTETHHSYVDMLDLVADPDAFAHARPGQRLSLTSRFQNLLAPTSISARLASLSNHIVPANYELNLGTLQTGQIVTNDANPFTLDLSGDIPLFHPALFVIDFFDREGNYAGSEPFEIVFNADFVNLRKNQLTTTLTSRGTIGFNYPNYTQGLGFLFRNGSNLIRAAGLMVGLSADRVVDNLYYASLDTFNQHFVPVQIASLTSNPVHADMEAGGSFTDAGAGQNAIGIDVDYKAYVWSQAPKDKFFILEYHITNNTTHSFSNLHIGFFADWILSDQRNHRADFDPGTRMGYSYSALGGHYTGVSLLTPGHMNYYAFDHSGTGGSIQISDGFSGAEKYQALSTNRAKAGVDAPDNDVSTLISSGPLALAPAQTLVVAFAILADDHLAGLQNSAREALTWYRFHHSFRRDSINDPASRQIVKVFPNPVGSSFQIGLLPARTGEAQLSVVDLKGRVLWSQPLYLEAGRIQIKKLSLPGIIPGAYLLKLDTGEHIEIKKIKRQ